MPLNKQVAGNHYKDMPIQVVEYNHLNNIGYMAGNIIKYVSRYTKKGGIEDLYKAEHYCQLLIDFVKMELPSKSQLVDSVTATSNLKDVQLKISENYDKS